LRHHPDGFVTAIWRKAGQVAASQPESQPESIEFRVLRLLQSLGYGTPDQVYRTANLKDFF
jgi:hypothetical protein